MNRAVWEISHRFDAEVVPLADRHYNRQKIGSPQFVPPGRCMVLKARTEEGTIGAFWVTSFPMAEYVKHEWAGAWVNSAFRNERADLWLSSDLIGGAVAATCWKWEVPPLGLVTFIDPTKVRHKRDLGRCYRRAGFHERGYTKGGLLALGLDNDEMPLPIAPLDASLSFDFGVPA